jgi:hypothetical protein
VTDSVVIGEHMEADETTVHTCECKCHEHAGLQPEDIRAVIRELTRHTYRNVVRWNPRPRGDGEVLE